MAARIVAPAESKLLDLWDYTPGLWGKEQADLYLRSLVERMHHLPLERPHWRPLADHRLPGIGFVRHQHHSVSFRELSPDMIGVITVLHERMNLPSRIREDADQAEESTRPDRS